MESIGAFLYHSKTMLVLWDPSYVGLSAHVSQQSRGSAALVCIRDGGLRLGPQARAKG